jgi:hypothetical protein
MTAENPAASSLSIELRILALYFRIFPYLRRCFPEFTPFERLFFLQIETKYGPLLLAILFALTILALFYQKRINRSWFEVPFLVVNLAFALSAGLCVLLGVPNIDPMPRQR